MGLRIYNASKIAAIAETFLPDYNISLGSFIL